MVQRCFCLSFTLLTDLYQFEYNHDPDLLWRSLHVQTALDNDTLDDENWQDWVPPAGDISVTGAISPDRVQGDVEIALQAQLDMNAPPHVRAM